MRVLSFAVAYLAAAELGHLLSLKGPEFVFATFWPPSGLAVAVLVYAPWRLWPAFLLAGATVSFFSNCVLHEQAMLLGLGFSAANVVVASLGAGLLRRSLGAPPQMTRVNDVLALVLWSGLVSTLFGATLAAVLVYLTFGHVPYGATWLAWWSADVAGILVVAPVALTWLATGLPLRFFEHQTVRGLAEGAVMFGGMAVVSELVFGEWMPTRFSAPVYVLPFLLWAGLRFGPRAAATATFLTCSIAVWHTCRGEGPYNVRFTGPADQLARMQGVLCVISLCSLMLAAVVAERRQAARDRLALIAELQQALDEIKTLRGLIPICAWCSKIRDDGGFWQSIERYLSKHTDAKFTHGICPECLAKHNQAMK